MHIPHHRPRTQYPNEPKKRNPRRYSNKADERHSAGVEAAPKLGSECNYYKVRSIAAWSVPYLLYRTDGGVRTAIIASTIAEATTGFGAQL